MKRIIVVEDDVLLLALYRSFLFREGYQVILYDTGKSIINLNYLRVDLFILDYHLPDGITGIDICRAIRKNKYTRYIPVIMVSGSIIPKQQLASAGVNDFLRKPVDTRALSLLIKKWLKQGKRGDE